MPFPDGHPKAVPPAAEPVRVVALAGGGFGASLLDLVAAADAAELVAVVASHEPGNPGTPCPYVTAWCARHGVPVRYYRTWRDGLAALELGAVPFDLLLSLSYDLILPAEALEIAPRAANLHKGIAPDFRGAYSTTWSLEEGAQEVGVTLHEMTADVDAGAILAQRRAALTPETTAAEAHALVDELAAALLADVLDDLLADRLEAVPQPAGGRTYGRELPPHEIEAEAVARRVRALWNPPHPPPALRVGDRRFEVREAAPGRAEALAAAGIAADDPAWPGWEPRRDNRAVLEGGAQALWFSTVAGAVAHLVSSLGRPVALPALAPPAIAAGVAAAGAGVRTFDLTETLDPEPLSLAAAAGTDALVVVPAPFGRPPSAAALELCRRYGLETLEDRTWAALAAAPPAGDYVVADWATWGGLPDGAALLCTKPVAPPQWDAPDQELLTLRLAAASALSEGDARGCAARLREAAEREDARPRAISRAALLTLWFERDLAARRAVAESRARALVRDGAGDVVITHWPSGWVAHGVPRLGGSAPRLESVWAPVDAWTPLPAGAAALAESIGVEATLPVGFTAPRGIAEAA